MTCLCTQQSRIFMYRITQPVRHKVPTACASKPSLGIALLDFLVAQTTSLVPYVTFVKILIGCTHSTPCQQPTETAPAPASAP